MLTRCKNVTAGGNNFNDFAENQPTCLPENISFQKIWGSKYLA